MGNASLCYRPDALMLTDNLMLTQPSKTKEVLLASSHSEQRSLRSSPHEDDVSPRGARDDASILQNLQNRMLAEASSLREEIDQEKSLRAKLERELAASAAIAETLKLRDAAIEGTLQLRDAAIAEKDALLQEREVLLLAEREKFEAVTKEVADLREELELERRSRAVVASGRAVDPDQQHAASEQESAVDDRRLPPPSRSRRRPTATSEHTMLGGSVLSAVSEEVQRTGEDGADVPLDGGGLAVVVSPAGETGLPPRTVSRSSRSGSAGEGSAVVEASGPPPAAEVDPVLPLEKLDPEQSETKIDLLEKTVQLKEQQLAEYGKTVYLNEQQLAEYNKQVAAQERELEARGKVIDDLETQIERQQLVLEDMRSTFSLGVSARTARKDLSAGENSSSSGDGRGGVGGGPPRAGASGVVLPDENTTHSDDEDEDLDDHLDLVPLSSKEQRSRAKDKPKTSERATSPGRPGSPLAGGPRPGSPGGADAISAALDIFGVLPDSDSSSDVVDAHHAESAPTPRPMLSTRSTEKSAPAPLRTTTPAAQNQAALLQEIEQLRKKDHEMQESLARLMDINTQLQSNLEKHRSRSPSPELRGGLEKHRSRSPSPELRGGSSSSEAPVNAGASEFALSPLKPQLPAHQQQEVQSRSTSKDSTGSDKRVTFRSPEVAAAPSDVSEAELRQAVRSFSEENESLRLQLEQEQLSHAEQLQQQLQQYLINISKL